MKKIRVKFKEINPEWKTVDEIPSPWGDEIYEVVQMVVNMFLFRGTTKEELELAAKEGRVKITRTGVDLICQ